MEITEDFQHRIIRPTFGQKQSRIRGPGGTLHVLGNDRLHHPYSNIDRGVHLGAIELQLA
jgi:hypothetical protein